MPKKQFDGIPLGKFKIKRKQKRCQGESFKKDKKSSTLFRSVLSFVLIIFMAGIALILGISGKNYTTSTNKFSSTRAQEDAKKEFKAMAVIETSTGRLLSGYHETEKLPMASTTKIATAIVTIEEMGDLSQEFVVPDKAVGIEGSVCSNQKQYYEHKG